VIFWVCAAAIVIAQVLILRSTRRAWQFGRDAKSPPSPTVGATAESSPGFAEWVFAVGPVVVLGVLLWATYRAVTL